MGLLIGAGLMLAGVDRSTSGHRRYTERDLTWIEEPLRRWDAAGHARLSTAIRAAVAAGARVERAFAILGEDVPDHLLQAGRLRLENKQASLEELGALSDPPLTKDAIAGRIRRLLAMADKRAHELNIPDTETVLTPDMLDL